MRISAAGRRASMRHGRCWISASAASSRRTSPTSSTTTASRTASCRSACRARCATQLIEDAKLGGNARITVDLERQVVVRPNGEEIHFDIDPFRKHLLLNGLDDIGQTMQHDTERSTATRRGRAPEPALAAGHRRPVRRTTMPANKKLLILPGDGIGPEVMREVRRVIDWMDRRRMVTFDISEDLVGGAAIDARGTPITDETMQKAKDADAILFGSVGGPKWDKLGFQLRPELAILRLRKELDLFANLRPAIGAGSAGRCLDAEARRGARPRPDDRARKHRRDLFRRAARRRDAAGRREARLRHRDLHHQRDRARGARGVRTGAQAARTACPAWRRPT